MPTGIPCANDSHAATQKRDLFHDQRNCRAVPAHDAIARATSTRPEVFLLDIGLPDMDGYEVAARLRPILKSTQLIALTGYGQADDIRQASAAGFDAHVIKPVDFAALVRILSAFEARDLRPS